MDADASQQICASLHERTPDRVDYRNGYRLRRWDIRAGTLDLRIPKRRHGSLPGGPTSTSRSRSSASDRSTLNPTRTVWLDALREVLGFDCGASEDDAFCLQ